MDIDIKKLNHVVTVARTRSFSRAAEELHITQPALSRSIANVEDRFGIKIFDRGRAGVTLTAVGSIAVAEAKALLSRARTLDHNLRLYGRGDAGRIAFGMGPLVASLLLPSLSGQFLRTRPQLQMQTSIKSAKLLVQELMSDSIEMFVCGIEQINASLDVTIEPAGSLRVALIVRSGHPLADYGGVSSSDLAPFPILSGAELSESMMNETGGIFVCDNYHILRETTLQSDGIWLSSSYLVSEDLKLGRLKEIALPDSILPVRTEIGVIYRTGRTLSPAATAISDFIRDYFATLPPASKDSV